MNRYGLMLNTMNYVRSLDYSQDWLIHYYARCYGSKLRRHNLLFLGVFYAVLSDPLAGGTVMAKIVRCMEHLLECFDIFPKASRSTAYMYSSD